MHSITMLMALPATWVKKSTELLEFIERNEVNEARDVMGSLRHNMFVTISFSLEFQTHLIISLNSKEKNNVSNILVFCFRK